MHLHTLIGAVTLLLLGCTKTIERDAPPHTTESAPDTASYSSETDSDPQSQDAIEARVDALLSQMTLEEKIDYIGGDRSFYIRPIERLGIPEIKMSDGPMGCRNWGPSTAYPAGIGAAATFDVDAAERLGVAVGRDCRARGVHILLGPGVNLHRSPLCGRNFEYFGEDPLLSGNIAAAYIRGVQSQGVVATVKHFTANNQEWDRNNISAEVDERTLREIYLAPFERAVREGRVGAVMTAYNLLNGTYCSHHSTLIKDILKGDFEFDGMVMSDWQAVHDAAGAFLGGCDLEMPEGAYLNQRNLLPLLENGTFSLSDLEDKVRRILRTIITMGFLDRPQTLSEIPEDDPLNRETALETARQGVVLLKNAADVLPLNRLDIKRLAVIGPNAAPAVTGGAGSSYVVPIRATSLLDALAAAAAPDIELAYHSGVQETDDAASILQMEAEVTTVAQSADAVIVAIGFGQSTEVNSAATAFDPAWPPLWATRGYVEAEGADRPFDLPAAQIQTVHLAAAANPNTIVVVNAGGAVNLVGFIDHIGALLWAWYPGGEGTRAVAEVIFGDINPSGKLPVTFAAQYEDYPSAPYYHLNDNGKTPYTEGIFVGYRGFEAADVMPLFPFGFGLSYTRFEFSDVSVALKDDGSAEITLTVANTFSQKGAEVVQVYVGAKSPSLPMPKKSLAAFSRVALLPGEHRIVTLPVEARAFAYWDVAAHEWKVDAGAYDISIGASSADIRLSATVVQKAQTIP